MWKRFREAIPSITFCTLIWCVLREFTDEKFTKTEWIFGFVAYMLIVAGLEHVWNFMKYVLTETDKPGYDHLKYCCGKLASQCTCDKEAE
ncbi:hypothetical protein KAR91_04730 [Candidatus Pacearchaeota archaeon]|nr:hypothetical protein [Candidatus Pacearchaeota archaeon]